MTISVNSLPPLSIPLTDDSGRMAPVWHEFFRQFVASTINGTISGEASSTTVAAGAGLVDVGSSVGEVILNVGTGQGITVNANDVNVDIHNQMSIPAELDDEILVADTTDNNLIKKTTIRSIASLSGAGAGGSPSQIQYNNSGLFEGDSGFTTDGAGTVSISTSLTIAAGTSIVGGAVDIIRFDGLSGAQSPRIQSDGAGGFSFYSGVSGSDTGSLYFKPSGPPWVTWAFNTSSISMANLTGMQFFGQMPVCRALMQNITANTVQTQGNSALTGDYNNIITV